MAMDLQLGKPVVTQDGKEIGSVDAIVFDPNSKELVQFMVKQGSLLSKDRIVAIQEIAGVDADGTVRLNIDSQLAEQLPPFVEREFVKVHPNEYPTLPPAFAAGTGAGPVYWGTGGPGLGYDPRASFFDTAPIDPPETEVRSNLADENDVVIRSGTDVVGSDGDKIGTVDDVFYDADNRITGFVVKEGFLFHHDVMIPADLVSNVTGEKVYLRVTSDEANAQAKPYRAGDKA